MSWTKMIISGRQMQSQAENICTGLYCSCKMAQRAK